jgi:hypothetical protein
MAIIIRNTGFSYPNGTFCCRYLYWKCGFARAGDSRKHVLRDSPTHLDLLCIHCIACMFENTREWCIFPSKEADGDGEMGTGQNDLAQPSKSALVHHRECLASPGLE